ncbi:MAG TPA: ComEC/Rec2 family competence protein, partial [Euzebyales bacterium]|nr:ComEC/Rec2 family competence protein [Euzebyales bacterium]
WLILRVSRIDDSGTSARVLLRMPPERRGDGGTDPDQGGGRGVGHAATGAAVGAPLAAVVRVTPLPDGAFGRYLRGLGVVASVTPVQQVRSAPAPRPIAVTTTVRRRATQVFEAALPATPAALLGGLALGSRDGIPTEELAASGLSHLVVVSGGHVAVLLAGLMAITGACGLGVRGRCRVALAAVWWFVVLTRWEPSVLRAAAMASLGLLAVLLGRARDTPHSLAATVIVLLLVDPLLARQVGFALSVLATTGVLAAVRWTGGRRPPLVVLAATVGAQIATAPVIVTLAGTVPVAALPANLVAAPAAAVAQTLGPGSAARAAVGLPGALVLARLAGLPLAVLWWCTDAFAWLPTLSARHLVAVLVPPLLVAALRAPRAVVAGVSAVTLAVATLLLSLPAPAPPALRLTLLDVGQGDGLLVEAPDGDGGARMVVDAGPDPLTMTADLRARRIRAVDAVVLTHGDHDHSGGIAEVLRRLRVSALFVPRGAGTGPHTLADSAREAIAVARARRIPVVGVHAGMRFALGDSVVEVLAPPRHMPVGAERNTGSVVLRVSGRHGRMLLTGDADATAQQLLLERPARLRAEVLKVPHHGGATNAPGFLDAVRATVAVTSLGRDNRYGHPHPETLADLAPVPVWRTDRHGAVTVTLTRTGPVVTTETSASPAAPSGVSDYRASSGPADSSSLRMSSATRSLNGLSRSNNSSGGTSLSGSPLPTSHGVASTAVRHAASSGSVSVVSVSVVSVAGAGLIRSR